MPYLMTPANYTQTMRPNLYNVAYRRVGAYKGMGRLHPSNYLEIGLRPNRIGGAAGQYNTLSTQLSLLPPGLRGMGMIMGRRGLGQSSVTPIIGPPADPVQAAYLQMQQLAAAGGAYPNIPADVGSGANILTSSGQLAPGAFPVNVQTGISNNTLLMIGAGLLLLLLAVRR